MQCLICKKEVQGECRSCFARLRATLKELPQLQFEAGFYLEPSRTGSGAVSAERFIGINVNALDFSMATDLLAILHSWESIVRRDRQLTPPALVTKQPTTDLEVLATCEFHIAHLSWTLTQPWAIDFAGEVWGLHARGRAAAKKFKEQARRIPCPTDDCTRFVVIDVEQMSQDVSCFECKQSWSVLRLVALAMSNKNRRFFLDIEAIAAWLQMTQREVYRLIKKFDIEKRGSTYDLQALMKVRQQIA
jgi:hypothetical protein